MDRYRVLIVDDDPETSLILANFLSDEYEAFVSENGLDALLQVDQVEPDIVIADVMMPIMCGLEFVRRLRSLERFSGTLVVFLSARKEDREIREGYETGADVYLTKPFDPETVRILLRNLIEDTGRARSRKAYSFRELSEFQLARRSFPQLEAGRDVPGSASPIPRVLVVDDDPLIVELLASACRPDFDVLKARDGLEALDLAYVFKPDLFIIDWMLPRVSGAQLVRVFQNTLEFLHAPIYMISARTGQRDIDYLNHLRVAGIFTKPVDPEEIVSALREATTRPEFRVHRHRPEIPATLSAGSLGLESGE